MTARLALDNVQKRIGRDLIVRGVSLDVQPGQIFGFLGPNGSGKTTTIRMILRLIRPTGGRVFVEGQDVHSRAGRNVHLGAQIDPPGLLPYLTGRQHLEMVGHLLGVEDMRRRADEILDLIDLHHAAHKAVGKYSSGMKRKLGVGMTLVGDPNLIVLDEPTAGLDPLGIREVRDIIRHVVAGGRRSVFVSSHLLSEIETECHRIALLNAGELVGLGTIEELLGGERPVAEFETDDPERADAVLADTAGRGEVTREAGRVIVRVARRSDIAPLVEKLVAAGLSVLGARFRRISLEEFFVAKTSGSPPTPASTTAHAA
jgi:ABC-2 type transport system ATP-binding protein